MVHMTQSLTANCCTQDKQVFLPIPTPPSQKKKRKKKLPINSNRTRNIKITQNQ